MSVVSVIIIYAFCQSFFSFFYKNGIFFVRATSGGGVNSENFHIFIKNAERLGKKRPLINMGLASAPSIKVNSADCKYRVTLLIPRMDWNLLEKRKRRLQKSSAELLEFLLKRHQRGNEKLLFANHQKLPVLYQDKGLGLRRCDFEVDSFVWHRFKALARFLQCLYVLFICRFSKNFRNSEQKWHYTKSAVV